MPLDATHQALVSLDDCAALRALGTPAGEAAARFTERRIEGYDRTQPMKRPNAAPVHDALAVASIVDPAVITTTFLHVDVETTGELTVGETVVDTNHRGDGEPNVHFALEADERAVRRCCCSNVRPDDTPAWPRPSRRAQRGPRRGMLP